MVLLGVDAYKRTHTLVAVDEVGCKLAEKSVPATSDGHLEALRWASCWTDRSWAIEVWGANTMSSSSRSRREATPRALNALTSGAGRALLRPASGPYATGRTPFGAVSRRIRVTRPQAISE